jgi:hypothetical protein
MRDLHRYTVREDWQKPRRYPNFSGPKHNDTRLISIASPPTIMIFIRKVFEGPGPFISCTKNKTSSISISSTRFATPRSG